MKTLLAILCLVAATASTQEPQLTVIESVTETFVGFIRPDGTAVAGPLKDFQPSTPNRPALSE